MAHRSRGAPRAGQTAQMPVIRAVRVGQRMKKRSAPNGYSGRAAAALGALALSLVVGFGCDDAGRAPSSPDAGDAGMGGSGGTGGAGSGGRPPIPPATFESCSPLAFTFNGSDCNSA